MNLYCQAGLSVERMQRYMSVETHVDGLVNALIPGCQVSAGVKLMSS